ncbi:MAG TPA: hypothetical protein VGO21_05970, partial [Candidatus Paceibacterota bacterium]|nr:hypothetical protein [Candidatus Paceibacterota bacterium]
MQYDNKIINSETLKILNKNYKLSIDFLSLIPIGEESYCYLGIEESGKKFFAKYCEKLEIIKNIESINNLLLELKNLDFIVSPLEAQGRTVFPVLKGKVYVYPYIEGEVMDMPNEQFNKDLVSKLMGIMVKIHSLGSTVKKNLPREDFVNNFFEKFQQLKKTFKNSLSGEDSKQLFTEKEKIISQLIENHTNLG